MSNITVVLVSRLTCPTSRSSLYRAPLLRSGQLELARERALPATFVVTGECGTRKTAAASEIALYRRCEHVSASRVVRVAVPRSCKQRQSVAVPRSCKQRQSVAVPRSCKQRQSVAVPRSCKQRQSGGCERCMCMPLLFLSSALFACYKQACGEGGELTVFAPLLPCVSTAQCRLLLARGSCSHSMLVPSTAVYFGARC
jgi:hypothetical protein